MELRVVNTPERGLVFNNLVYMSKPPAERVRVGDFLFNCQAHSLLDSDALALNSAQRRCAGFELAAHLRVVPVDQTPPNVAKQLVIDVDNATASATRTALDCYDVAEDFVQTFDGHFLRPRQQLLLQHGPARLLLTVRGGQGMVNRRTAVRFESQHVPMLQPVRRFDFGSMGIGGLQRESDQLFRRAFASRLAPPARMRALGVSHVKGVLLHGPPGTGKTLIARKLSQTLTGIEPKVVNGPEVLNRYVGASEENIRNLFRDAEDAQKKGTAGLHVIIFDEIDAICKQRGTSTGGAQVGDSVVNQLLTKMDGVEPLHNIVVIGLTNRLDLLDCALLRPGRFEVQIEVSLPSAGGRRDILDIHTATMRSNGLLSQSFDPAVLVDSTKNFSGAEIEGLVKSAASHAMARGGDDEWEVDQDDFLRALQEVRPRFGSDMPPGVADEELCEQAQAIFSSSHSRVLLAFPGGAQAARALALHHAAPFTRILRGQDLAVMTTQSKVGCLVEAFEHGAKSQDSLILLDDLELTLEYCDVGPVFCNKTLQALKAVLRREPPPGHRLFVLAANSRAEAIQLLGLTAAFDLTLDSIAVISGPLNSV